ncbi:MAG: glycosyltransferase [Planctomycetales bacterium]|nr:glycosyltransferase [Planctomycetales bacterium]
MKVLLTGIEYFANQIQHAVQECDSDFSFSRISVKSPRWPIAAITLMRKRTIDLWYHVGGYHTWGVNLPMTSVAARYNVRSVIHWAGTDVLTVSAAKFRGFFRHTVVATHWAGAPWLKEELSAFCVDDVLYVPFPLSEVAKACSGTAKPFPSKMVVLSYASSQSRATFYGYDTIHRLAKSFPGIEFRIAGIFRPADIVELPNVHFLGWRKDMTPLYEDSVLILRIVPHDGFSGMVQEALAHGRYVIWKYDVPGVVSATDYHDIHTAIHSFYVRFRAQQLPLNGEGRTFVSQHLSQDRIGNEIVRRLRSV